jgi:hypothetical protein
MGAHRARGVSFEIVTVTQFRLRRRRAGLARELPSLIHQSPFGVNMAASPRPRATMAGRKSISPNSSLPGSSTSRPPHSGVTLSARHAQEAKVGPPRPSAKGPARPVSINPTPQAKPNKSPHSMFPVTKPGQKTSARKQPPPLPGARLRPPPFPGSLRPSLAVSARESRSLAPKAAEIPGKTRSNSLAPRTTLKPSKR